MNSGSSDQWRLIHGDARSELAQISSGSIDVVITSPPYYRKRRYGGANEIGWEKTPDAYVEALLGVFGEVHRVLAEHGSLWLVLGDSYRRKRLLGMPWRIALALADAGWVLRAEVIWWKRGAMPESSQDRPVREHETIFFFTKNPRDYWYDEIAARAFRVEDSSRRNPGNLRSVWGKAPPRYASDHYATFPLGLAQRMVELSCPFEVCASCGEPRRRRLTRISLGRWELPRTHPDYRPREYAATKTRSGIHAGRGQRFAEVSHDDWVECCQDAFRPGVVADPFAGTGTTLEAALSAGRSALGIDSHAPYIEIAHKRLALRLQKNGSV